MHTPKVENMNSIRTGAKVANQFIITDKRGDRYFQSYDTVIAIKRFTLKPSIILDVNSWDYSRTTLKYLAQFLRYETGVAINSKKEIEKQIKSGEYALSDLN